MAELRAQAERLEQRLRPVRLLWGELSGMMQAREDRLHASSDLQQFLQKLDLFQLWLSRGQAAAASTDLPTGMRICRSEILYSTCKYSTAVQKNAV